MAAKCGQRKRSNVDNSAMHRGIIDIKKPFLMRYYMFTLARMDTSRWHLQATGSRCLNSQSEKFDWLLLTNVWKHLPLNTSFVSQSVEE